MTQMEAVNAAVERLIAAGMVLRYISVSSSSHYLGWPGRSGLLRVSDHPNRNGRESGVYARVTFSEQGVLCLTDAGLFDATAAALGRYMLLAPKDKK